LSIALTVRELGLVEYQPTWEAMQAFTSTREDRKSVV
jgi:lipoate-protein ligase B